MSWTMHDKEFAALISSPAAERYRYFVKKVADNGIIWSLRSGEGWILLGDDSGHELVPVWPHERFAAAYAAQVDSTSAASPISLDVFLERWIPGMVRDGRLVAVFPVPEGKGIVALPERLKEDLEQELALFE